MKKVFSILMVAFAMTAMVACGEKDNGTDTPGGTPSGGDNPGGGGTTAQTDTTIMNYTLMRSLLDIDWSEACGRVMAMGFTEIDSDEGENVRAFIKGSLMGDYYACYLRCDYPEVDNLVGSVVMQEHHMNSSTQTACVENLIYLVNDERSVLSDMEINTAGCGGIIMWNDVTASGRDGDQSYFPGHSAFGDFAAALRALSVHTSVNASWADNYIYNGSMYVATGTAVCTSSAYASIMENIITLEKEDNLD